MKETVEILDKCVQNRVKCGKKKVLKRENAPKMKKEKKT